MTSQSQSISLDEARLIIAQCVEQSDFELLKVEETVLKNTSGGFMSDYLRIEICIRLPNDKEKVYNFFSKTVSRSPGMHRDFVSEVQCYHKEIGFYNTIIPLLEKYEKKASKRNEKSLKGKWAPYCFYTRDDIIVMEDLSASGFKILNSRDLLNWNLCVCVMKTLASFHAASLVFEEKEKSQEVKKWRIIDRHPEFFEMVLNRHMPGQENKGWFAAGIRALVALVPYLTKYQHSKTLQKLIQEKLPNACDSIKVLGRSDEFRNVVCHGDLWSSNILFRYGSDCRPEMARFVDFQLLNYAPPALDLTVFIYSTTNRSFRERHRDALLGVYYDELSAELQSQGLSADTLLPKNELQKSFEDFSAAGRTIAVLYYQTVNMDTEQRNKVFTPAEKFSTFFLDNREREVCEFFQTDEVYRHRLEEAMNELIESDILAKYKVKLTQK